jgi:hypothetical protein
VRGDQVFEQHKAEIAGVDEARPVRRNLDAGEPVLAGAGMADVQGQ